jgi:hypothetical protein
VHYVLPLFASFKWLNSGLVQNRKSLFLKILYWLKYLCPLCLKCLLLRLCALWDLLWIWIFCYTLYRNMSGLPDDLLPHGLLDLWCSEMSFHTGYIATPVLDFHLWSFAWRGQEEHQHLKIIIWLIMRSDYNKILLFIHT